MQIISKTLEDTRKFAKNLVELLSKHESDHATILDLEGNLGAGKTTLVQMIGQELGVKETIQSPTFVLMKSYRTNNPPARDLPNQAWRAGLKFKNLVHIDAYRIEHIEEAKILNLEEVFGDKNNLVCIEWAEKIREAVPDDSVKVVCELLEEDEHGYEIQC